ncbi:FKBP-type peptidyl-prolyl cis-trans isomerase FkpA/FKBP-type peptidyl-prolyl cis-trans isomerase FklB [Luteibacter sp. Sphag1AF]|uniref:FKBP-type peptidyl-prolyl cis-trans isomerase N-terminal domain-containing protein n=1 Tax=Luteibacter sp. Sphag1AF TaxID=2587031 RepID=UPI001614E91B|nr:FKBP-type peptidyl-prolyl cis-trans isomerase [Luteibacter sp. Sphag1AF]MBB3228470.1 FKBP-type peptidyl-prolyl cis-trans isomerase FkpA/FKBP-type peptidyl-prolyl cis-trans isomerase FklB [Luteibacter sp. Sphag1AF]
MKHFLRPTMTAAALAVALATTAGASAQAAKTPKAAATSAAPAGAVDKQKASYVVGWDIASQLPPLVRAELDPATVGKAVQAALSGQQPTMSNEEAKAVRDAFTTQLKAKAEREYNAESTKNAAEGAAFLAKNKSAPGVKTTASGLQYEVIQAGTGQRPGPSDTVSINYTGTFVNGEVFDASAAHKDAEHPNGAPATIPLASVIPGFREGLQLMQVGGKYKLFIPAAIAYGAKPENGFPPNATIIFEVELLKTAATPAGAGPQGGAGK